MVCKPKQITTFLYLSDLLLNRFKHPASSSILKLLYHRYRISFSLASETGSYFVGAI